MSPREDERATGDGRVDRMTRGSVVHLLGGPYVSVAGSTREVPEGGKRLLAFVALRGMPVERRQVAGVLWPECPDDRAAGNLRSALWRLRRSGVEVLDQDKWAVGLCDDVHVDVHRLHSWADRVIGGRSSPEDLRIDRVSGPAMWDLLPGWSEDWATMERERLRQRVLHAMETLSRRLSGTGRHADAVEAALVAVLADPLRESAQRALIESHLAEANWVEAKRAFVAYRERLAEELRLSPSAALVAMLRDGVRANRSTPAEPRAAGRR